MPAAVIVPAAISAASTIFASHKAKQATDKAAATATAEQDKALQQQSSLSQPYRSLGQAAIPQLEALLGISSPTRGSPLAHLPGVARPAADPTAALRATPGYQFARDEGLNAAKNAATVMGPGFSSGNTLEALERFGTGLADQTYQSAVGNLQNAVGIGQAAAAGQAANIGNAATNVGNIALNRGSTLAGIDVNTVAGLARAGGNAYQDYQLSQVLKGLQNPGGGTLGEVGLPTGIGYLPGGTGNVITDQQIMPMPAGP